MLIERHSLDNPGVTRELCLAPSGGIAHSQTPERGQGELSKLFFTGFKIYYLSFINFDFLRR
jgi:hypothetical protein